MLLYGSGDKVSHKVGEITSPFPSYHSAVDNSTIKLATRRGQLCMMQTVLIGAEAMTKGLEKEARVEAHERTCF